MTTPSASPAAPPNRPVFVLGERSAALEVVRALGSTANFAAMPASRLLADLVATVDRWAPVLDPLGALGRNGLRPAHWYREVQKAQMRAAGKPRTVEFSSLSVLRLCILFPRAQFVVVRQLKRAMPRSRRLPDLAEGRIVAIDSQGATTPETLERILAFLGATAETIEVDVSDTAVGAAPFREAPEAELRRS